ASCVLICVMRLLATSSTVTGTAAPSSVKIRVMPTLRPTSPRLIFVFLQSRRLRLTGGEFSNVRSIQILSCNILLSRNCALVRGHIPASRGPPAPRSLALLELYLHIDAGRQIELHQLVDGLVGRIDDVHQPQMRAYLELVARRLVHMRRAQDVEPLDLGRQRHRTLDDGARPLRGLDDFLRRLVDQLVVERLQADADSLVLHLNSRLTAASSALL